METLIRPLNIKNFNIMPGGSFFSRRGTQYHQASDYLVGVNTPVYASNSGTLIDASGSKCGIGAIIRGNRNSNYQTGYCHLSKFAPDIELGLNNLGSVDVKQGQLIGYTGKSGNAQNTPAHLHFKVRNKQTGIALDPEQIVYKQNYRYKGFNWWSVIFGAFTIYALVHAYNDEKKRPLKK